MTQDAIDYSRLVQAALLDGVVRRALEIAAQGGLPGAHHFFLAFRTDHPEVEIPDALRDAYPEEMTIVIQHQYRDLVVEDDGFGVTLAFSGVERRLWVPFQALVAFVDPSVELQLGFVPEGVEIDDGDEAGDADASTWAEDRDSEGRDPENAEPEDNVVSFRDFRRRGR
jgi:hypothetical protein